MTAPDKLEPRDYLLTDERLAEWAEYAKQDNAGQIFVPSDIRLLIGEIQRLRASHPAPSPEAGEVMRLAEGWANAAENLGVARCNYASSGQIEADTCRDWENAFRAYVTTMMAAKGERG